MIEGEATQTQEQQVSNPVPDTTGYVEPTGGEMDMSNLNVSDIVFGDDDEEHKDTNETQNQDQNSNTTTDSDATDVQTQTDSGEASTEGEVQTEGGTSDASTDNQAVDGSTEQEYDGYGYLTEETGVEITSDDDIVSSLKELADFRSGKMQSNDSLSPAIQQAIEVERAGGDLSEHFRRVGMDFESMDASEVMRQKFFRDNASLHKQNPKLAQMKFEREMENKYGLYSKYSSLSDDIDKQDFADENGLDNIEYEKLLMENDVAQARQELQAWQKESVPVQSNTNGQQEIPQASEEDIQAYQKQANDSIENFEAVTISIGDGLPEYNLGLNDKTRPLVEGWTKQPFTFLQAIGFEKDSIDTERLMPIMTLIAEASEGTLGSRLKDFVVNQENIETIEKRVDNANNYQKNAPAPSDEGDIWEQIGEAAEQARNERYARR